MINSPRGGLSILANSLRSRSPGLARQQVPELAEDLSVREVGERVVIIGLARVGSAEHVPADSDQVPPGPRMPWVGEFVDATVQRPITQQAR
jgi:hypothetical protein